MTNNMASRPALIRKPRTLTLRDAEPDRWEPEVHRDRFVRSLRGNFEGGAGPRQLVHLHIRWENLPWIMRKIWAAWWAHKKDMLGHLAWVEKELGGGGVARPQDSP